MGILDFFKNKRIKKAEEIKKIINEIDSESVIRLHYVSIEKFNRYSDNATMYGKTEDLYGPVRLPNGMSKEDAYKVISYLSEKIEKENNLEPASEKSVKMVDEILGNYGFERVDGIRRSGHFHSVSDHVPMECDKVDGVTDLFTVGGHLSLFHKTKTNKERYFDWFIADIKEQDVKEIYSKLGLNIDNLQKYNYISK